MKRYTRYVYVFAFVGALAALHAPFAHASLEWEYVELETHAAAGDSEVHAQFPFTNAGPAPVTIIRVATSCGCTPAHLAKRTYAPGESGVIEVVYNIGENTGPQASTIAVSTDEPDDAIALLRWTIHVPEVLSLDPRNLSWTQGEPAESKTITVTVAPEHTVQVLGARVSSPEFAAEVNTVEKGRRYEVVVIPRSTSQALNGVLAIHTDFPRDNPALYRALARVVPPAPGADSGVSAAAAGLPVRMTPRVLTWRVGEAAAPKEMVIEAEGEAPVKIAGVRSNNPAFHASLAEESPSKSYILSVTPTSTDASGRAVLTLETAPETPVDQPIAAVAIILPGSAG